MEKKAQNMPPLKIWEKRYFKRVDDDSFIGYTLSMLSDKGLLKCSCNASAVDLLISTITQKKVLPKSGNNIILEKLKETIKKLGGKQ